MHGNNNDVHLGLRLFKRDRRYSFKWYNVHCTLYNDS